MAYPGKAGRFRELTEDVVSGVSAEGDAASVRLGIEGMVGSSVDSGAGSAAAWLSWN